MACKDCNAGWIAGEPGGGGVRWVPCSCSVRDVRMPDFIVLPVGKNPSGVKITHEIDVCLAGEPALNGCCGSLDCVCAPRLEPNVTRLRKGDTLFYFVSGDEETIEARGIDGNHYLLPRADTVLYAPIPQSTLRELRTPAISGPRL